MRIRQSSSVLFFLGKNCRDNLMDEDEKDRAKEVRDI